MKKVLLLSLPVVALAAPLAVMLSPAHAAPRTTVKADAASPCPGWSVETTVLTDSPVQTAHIGIPEAQYVFAFATIPTRPVSVYNQPTGIYAPYGSWDICWRLQGANAIGYYGVTFLWNNGTRSWWSAPAAAGGPYVGAGHGTLFTFQCTARYGADTFWLNTPSQYVTLGWTSGYPTPVESPRGPSYNVDDFTAHTGPFCS
jgi:hypothetical protein